MTGLIKIFSEYYIHRYKRIVYLGQFYVTRLPISIRELFPYCYSESIDQKRILRFSRNQSNTRTCNVHTTEILDLITNLPRLRHGVKFRSFINFQHQGKCNLRFCPFFLRRTNIQRLFFDANWKRLLVDETKRNETEREKISILRELSLATPFPSLCFVEHSTNNRPTPVAQYNDIPRRNTFTCLHPPRMKLSREVAYKYITIRTQYSIVLLAIPRTRSDFPFSAQRDSTLRVRVIRALHACTRGIREKYNSVDTLACSLGNEKSMGGSRY